MRKLIVFLLLTATICLVLSVFLINSLQVNKPQEPVASGEFPENPEWIFTGDSAVLSTPVYREGIIFVRTAVSVYAVNRTDGTMHWRSDSPGLSPVSVEPKIAHGMVFVPEDKSRIAAFDATSGSLIWRSEEIDFRYGSTENSEIVDIEVDDHCLYIVRDSWELACYSPTSGNEIWTTRVPDRRILFLSVDDNYVYLAASHFVRAYNKDTGEIKSEMIFEEHIGPIFAMNDRLFISLANTELQATMAKTRQIMWKTILDKENGEILHSLTSIGNVLYAASDRLYSVSPIDGEIIWRSDLEGDLEKPVMLKDKIYIRNESTTLFSLDSRTGERTGELLVQPNTNSRFDPFRGPAVADDLLIVPFGDNRVFAYRP